MPARVFWQLATRFEALVDCLSVDEVGNLEGVDKIAIYHFREQLEERQSTFP